MSSFNKLFLLTFSTITLILFAETLTITQSQEHQKNLELEKLLYQINKPAIKSFQTKHGDIMDCIDIYKQLAFDHPLLKNHSIQLSPTNLHKWTKKTGSIPFLEDHNMSCPQGTVIFKRVTLQDLVQAQHLKSMGFHNSRHVSSKSRNTNLAGHHFGVAIHKDYNYGARGNLNVWNPKVSSDQFSLASVSVANGNEEELQSISAGWIAYKSFHKKQSCLFTYWTVDGISKTGCYNTLCPGYVHVNSKYALGDLIQPISTYNGQQYDLDISLYQDDITGHWWLILVNEPIGYWPKPLFKVAGLANGASLVSWGGEVYSSMKMKSPRMGSGHFPEEGFKKAAYVNDIQVITKTSQKFISPEASSLEIYTNSPNCYEAEMKLGFGGVWSNAVFYGGPGGC